MQGEFTLFWSIIVPAVMAAGSVVITYTLYRHFAGKTDRRYQAEQEEQGRAE